MSERNDQIKTVIRKIVREEVNLVLDEVREALPGLIAEAFSGIIAEAMSKGGGKQSRPRKQLQEASYSVSEDEFDDYPTSNRGKLMEMVGNRGTGGGSGGETNVRVTERYASSGNPIPVNPGDIPDFVNDAITKDYRQQMSAMFKKLGPNG